MNGAQYDSWLTVGITDGASNGALSSIGIDFDAWTVDSALSTSDGAVSWIAPDDGPEAGTDAVVGQLTTAAGSSGSVSTGMQGACPQEKTGNQIQSSSPTKHSST